MFLVCALPILFNLVTVFRKKRPISKKINYHVTVHAEILVRGPTKPTEIQKPVLLRVSDRL